MADEIPTQEELTKLRVVDLRKKLSALALPTGGNKAELVARLHSHLTEQPGTDVPATSQEQDEAMDTSEPASEQAEPTEEKPEQPATDDGQVTESVSQDPSQTESQADEQVEQQEAEEKARQEAEEQALQLAEAKEVQARKAAEEAQARKAAEEAEARKEAELAQARKEAEEAEARRKEAEEKAKQEAEIQAKRELEEKARLAAIESARRMAEKKAAEQARMEAEKKAEQERIAAEEAARLEAEKKEKEAELAKQAEQEAREAAEKARLEREEKARMASIEATLAEEAKVRKEAAERAAAQSAAQVNQNHEADDESEEKEKLTKNQLRKKRKKNRAERRAAERKAAETVEEDVEEDQTDDSGVEVEYIQEEPLIDPMNPLFNQFHKIFQTFKIEDPVVVPSSSDQPSTDPTKVKDEDDPTLTKRGAAHFGELEIEERQVDKSKLSKKKLKKLTRMTVAELKTVVTRPDLVEMHDVCAPDPKLLLALKATRNTVPVPRHWCNKRKYLQGKRGVEKPPFELPDYIIATGIMEMRQALAEKEEEKSLKQKMREKVRPKMGKIDIDYQKLHDAFFKHQRKPKMTVHGDLYYEGKEFETKLKEKKPGNLTDELRTALGMPIGAGSDKFPPPWLIAMQRYGPPPSYPNLKIQGLNCPIPDGCSFGYHAGGWGKPPVDELGKPLYGDVFGQSGGGLDAQPITEDNIDHSVWGEMESESSEEEESSEESGDEKDEDIAEGLVTPADAGLITPSGMTSIPAGLETPDAIELRKRIEDAMDQGGETPSLYQVLPEKRAQVGAAMMGSAHTYDMAGTKRVTSEGIEVALNPEELDLDNVAMQAKYDQTVRAQQANVEKEDLSDMVAEHAAKAAKKRKKMQSQDKASKKHKDFKF